MPFPSYYSSRQVDLWICVKMKNFQPLEIDQRENSITRSVTNRYISKSKRVIFDSSITIVGYRKKNHQWSYTRVISNVKKITRHWLPLNLTHRVGRSLLSKVILASMYEICIDPNHNYLYHRSTDPKKRNANLPHWFTLVVGSSMEEDGSTTPQESLEHIHSITNRLHRNKELTLDASFDQWPPLPINNTPYNNTTTTHLLHMTPL